MLTFVRSHWAAAGAVALALVVTGVVLVWPTRSDTAVLDTVEVAGYERRGDDYTPDGMSLSRFWTGTADPASAVTVDGGRLNPPLDGGGVDPSGQATIGWLPPVGPDICQLTVFRIAEPGPAERATADLGLSGAELTAVSEGRLNLLRAVVMCGGG